MSTAEEELPDDLEEALNNFNSSLDGLEAKLQPLLNADYGTFQATLEPAERAQLLLALAFASNSLFWMYLNASGIDPRQHPIKNEVDRIKEYMNKLKQATTAAEPVPSHQKIDKVAATRFLKAALVDADDDVKAKLAEQVAKTDREKKAEKAEKAAAQRATEGDIARQVEKIAKKSKGSNKGTLSMHKRSRDELATPPTTGSGKKKKSKH